MKNRLFSELAWCNIKKTLKPMPRWWPVWVWFQILFVSATPTIVGLIFSFFLKDANEIFALIFTCVFGGFLCFLFVAAGLDYLSYIKKYKAGYEDLKASYPLYSERDFYLKVKSSLAKKWEQEKEEIKKRQLEKSNQIRKQYDL